MKNKLAIIIPFFNNSDYTIKCIQSIIGDSGNIEKSFYLVDDGSDTKYENEIRSYLKSINKNYSYKYIKGNGSWWWAKSLSIGLKEAYLDGFELFLFMNNDNLLKTEALNKLVSIFINNNLDILGSIVIFKNNKIKHYGVVFDSKTGRIFHNNMNENINQVKFEKEFIQVDSLGGQGVIINKKVIDKLGYLDYETFPQYGSDLDFYLRAKKIGINIYVTHKAIVIDDEENTGLLKSQNKTSFIDFIKSFKSIKSHMSINVKFNIYKRHVKSYYLYRLVILYIKYIINYFLRRI